MVDHLLANKFIWLVDNSANFLAILGGISLEAGAREAIGKPFQGRNELDKSGKRDRSAGEVGHHAVNQPNQWIGPMGVDSIAVYEFKNKCARFTTRRVSVTWFTDIIELPCLPSYPFQV